MNGIASGVGSCTAHEYGISGSADIGADWKARRRKGDQRGGFGNVPEGQSFRTTKNRRQPNTGGQDDQPPTIPSQPRIRRRGSMSNKEKLAKLRRRIRKLTALTKSQVRSIKFEERKARRRAA